MIGDYGEFIALQVAMHVSDPSYDGQALEFGCTVIFLGFIEGAASVDDYAFALLKIL